MCAPGWILLVQLHVDLPGAKVVIATLPGPGSSGGTGVLLFLIAFGTDYWLLATDTCGVGNEILTFHHEGFFWRCWFFGEGHPESIWTFWYTSQAHPKFCMHGYLFPMPIAVGPFPHPSYDTTAVYRGFWTAFILLAVAAGLVGGLLLVCGVPFSSPHSYKVGGGFLEELCHEIRSFSEKPQLNCRSFTSSCCPIINISENI
uniref:Transmembrane protein 182 n=1 Tax=Geospiza parvula TaxID=87175 RepID=A0A8C3Q8P8_GEOPR